MPGEKDLPVYNAVTLSKAILACIATTKVNLGQVNNFSELNKVKGEALHEMFFAKTSYPGNVNHNAPAIILLFLYNPEIVLDIMNKMAELSKGDDFFVGELVQICKIPGVTVKPSDFFGAINTPKFDNNIIELKNHATNLKKNTLIRQFLSETQDPIKFLKDNEAKLNYKPTTELKFEALQSRLTILSALNEIKTNPEFKSHRDSSTNRALKELVLTLFTVGIANIINKCSTGKWSFFHHAPASAVKLAAVEKSFMSK